MNKYKLKKTDAITYLLNLFLKQGIDYVYIMVDFICMGLLELLGKFLLIVRLEPPTFRLQSDRPNHCATKSDSIDKLNVYHN